MGSGASTRGKIAAASEAELADTVAGLDSSIVQKLRAALLDSDGPGMETVTVTMASGQSRECQIKSGMRLLDLWKDAADKFGIPGAEAVLCLGSREYTVAELDQNLDTLGISHGAHLACLHRSYHFRVEGAVDVDAALPAGVEAVTVTVASGQSKECQIESSMRLVDLRKDAADKFGIPCVEAVLCLGSREYTVAELDQRLYTLGISHGAHLACVHRSNCTGVEGSVVVELRGYKLCIVTTDTTVEIPIDGLRNKLALELYYLTSNEVVADACARARELLSGKEVYFVIEAATASGSALCSLILPALGAEVESSSWHVILIMPASPACLPLLRGDANVRFLTVLNFYRSRNLFHWKHAYMLVDAADWYVMGPAAAAETATVMPLAEPACYTHPATDVLHAVVQAFENRRNLRTGMYPFMQYGIEEGELMEALDSAKDEIPYVEEQESKGLVGPEAELMKTAPDQFLQAQFGRTRSL